MPCMCHPRVRVSKLPCGLLDNKSAVALLASAGFRPLLMVPDAVTGPGACHEAFLVHAAGEDSLKDVQRVEKDLKEAHN